MNKNIANSQVEDQLEETHSTNPDPKPWLQHLLDDTFAIFEGYASEDDENNSEEVK